MKITFENVISGRIFDNQWRDLTEEERTNALEEIKSFLLSTCRANSETSKAIIRMSLSNLPENIGIYRRLRTTEYVAGQDYPGELRYIKEQIKKYC